MHRSHQHHMAPTRRMRFAIAVSAALVVAASVLGQVSPSSAEEGSAPVPTRSGILADNSASVGGGFWNYGTGGGKVYSKYHHPKLYHSATACNRAVFQTCDKKYAAAGQWANASTNATWNAADRAYWATY